MGKWYPYSTWSEKTIAVFLHIYVIRANLLLFCDHQDTESESFEIETSIFQTISTHKKISKDLLDNDIHTLQDWWKILWFFSYLWSYSYCQTILWSPWNWVGVMGNGNWCISINIHPEKYQRLYGKIIITL